MEPIRIKSPADAISYMGHSLGYWPQESLVCVALEGIGLGPTLRVNLPSNVDFVETYAEHVAQFFGRDHDATAMLVALFTHLPWAKGHSKPYIPLVQELKRQFAAAGVLVRSVWIVGPTSFAQYDGADHNSCGNETPISALESSTLNAELVYQGSVIESSDPVSIPRNTATQENTIAVETALRAMGSKTVERLEATRQLWMDLIDHDSEPTHEELTGLLAGLQFVGLRDEILADMPGSDEPMAATLFGATTEAPQWDRIDNGEKLLRQLLTIAVPAYAAAPLTMLGHICWWKGKGTAAANYMHVALTFDPDYHLARLLEQMLDAGVVSGWAQHKDTAYRTHR